jgi:hypothetical protein
MADGLHTPIRNRTKKPLAIALSGGGEGAEWERRWGQCNNVQCKCNQNCHYESPHIVNIT